VRSRFDSHSGPNVPDPKHMIQEIRDELVAQQKLWAEKLGQDPACFADLEPQVHQTFQQYADRLVASLLAQAGQQPGLEEQAKKK
jgi:hypothetical protein